MFQALRHRNFRWYWFSNIWQAAANGMQFLVLGWLVLRLTDDSATQLGLVIFLYGIANLGLVIFGGIFADRLDRRLLLVSSMTVVVILIAAIATVKISGVVVLWHIYVTAVILGIVQGINGPARMAWVVDLVDRDDIMNAVTLNSAVMNSGRIIGPAIAGVIIDVSGIGATLYFTAGCYLLGVIFLLPISDTSRPRLTANNTILRDISDGMRFVWTTPVAFAIIGIGFGFGFFAAAYIQVMPAFAKDVLEVGAGGAGLLIAATGIGSLLGSLLLASLGNARYKNWLLLGTILTFDLTLLAFAWSSWFWVSWVILLFVGMGFTGYISMGTIVLQLTVPPQLLGRVMSLWLLGAAFHYMGALPLGILADVASWPTSIATGATIFLCVVIVLGLWRPALRKLSV